MIRPTWNRVLVRPEPPKDTTEGGIVLPTSLQAKGEAGILFGHIVAIGPCKGDELKAATANDGLPFGVGDRVAYAFKAAPKFSDCLLLDFANILAVVP